MTKENGDEGEVGFIYLLRFAHNPIKHARHYSGWTNDLDKRLDLHRKGRGSRLMAVVKEAGGSFILTNVTLGTRTQERQYKKRGGKSKDCPLCKARMSLK